MVQLFDLGGDGTAEASDRVLTVPNALSAARLCILPYLYVVLARGDLAWGLAVGFVFGVTDFVDGYVARRFDQVTKLGQLLDPVSDRLFIMTVAVGIVVAGLVPWWAVAAIFVRDVLIFLVGAFLLSRGAGAPPVTRLGKASTFGLMWSYVALLAAGIIGTAREPQPAVYAVGFAMLVVSLVLYWLTAVGYARVVLAGTDPVEPSRSSTPSSR